MSEENKVINSKNKSLKILSIVLGVFATITLVAYFSFNFLQNKNDKNKTEQLKSHNSDDIFDLSEEYLNSTEQDRSNLNDISVAELQEKGAEFVYQMLLKNQIQINELRSNLQKIQDEFTKYKTREAFSKIVFSYIELRQKIFSNNSNLENYENSLQNVETLAITDNILHEKITQLRPLLKDFIGAKNLEKDFKSLIPEIIATKNDLNVNNNFLNKIRHKFYKIIVIRRIDGKNPEDVDSTVVRIEKLLKDQNYQEALNNLLTLDQSYHNVTANFLLKLNVAVELQKVDSEILSYLKTVS